MPTKRIAYFVTPHGFGHAARAAAVMEALSEIEILNNLIILPHRSDLSKSY